MIQNSFVKKEKKVNRSLTLEPSTVEGVKIGMKSNGVQYSVRDYRNKYFFPHEWNQFFNQLKENKRFIFDMLIHTGARIEEALCIKANHIRWDRRYLTLYVTKVKAKKNETKPVPRDITFSSKFARRLRKYIEENNIGDSEFLFLDNTKQYPTRQDLKRETNIRKITLSQMMKRTLQKSDIPEWYMFSLHNIRKTHGMWLKSLNVKMEEICKKLGHDYNTYLKHYGSADIFNDRDRKEMLNILGEDFQGT